MIILDVEQNTDEWFKARMGIPTASSMDKILTSTGKPSTQSKAYMNKLLAEWYTGEHDSIKQNEWMERGHELESEARSLYGFMFDCEPKQVGLIYKDDRKLISCSPDALINNSVGLEIKSPAPHTHIEYLLNNKLPTKYKIQVQSSLYVTGFDKWVFQSYHPTMPPLIIEVGRDEKLIKLIDEASNNFIDEMLKKREQLKQLREAA